MNGAAVTEIPLTRETIAARLEELRTELARGRRRAEMLEAEQHELRATTLRISGAIQVLEELLADPALASGEE